MAAMSCNIVVMRATGAAIIAPQTLVSNAQMQTLLLKHHWSPSFDLKSDQPRDARGRSGSRIILEMDTRVFAVQHGSIIVIALEMDTRFYRTTR